MENTIKVFDRQSLLDVALQHTGDASNAFAIAIANGMSVSDDLIAGTDLVLPEVVMNKDILNYYTAKQIKPATYFTELYDGNTPQLGGIGYMQIGNTFKVS